MLQLLRSPRRYQQDNITILDNKLNLQCLIDVAGIFHTYMLHRNVLGKSAPYVPRQGYSQVS
jgi:hypothetical protein